MSVSALGYEGKYRHDPSGQGQLGQLQRDLYRLIREQRQLRDEGLSPHWKGVEDRRNPIIRYVPWWIIAAAGLCILTGAFVVLTRSSRLQAGPIKTALAELVNPVDYPAPAPRAPTG